LCLFSGYIYLDQNPTNFPLLASTGISSLDNLLGSDGYPDKSAILVVGPPGIGKEALGYWFIRTGLVQDDFSFYVTKRSVHEVVRDAAGFGVDYAQKGPFWMARDGGQLKFNISDLQALSFDIKGKLKENTNRRIRIAMDVLSPLLMLNSPETIYRFLTQLFEEVKRYDVVVLATLEEGMHQLQVVSAMQELFDGVIELKFYEERLTALPLFRIRKMIGTPTHPAYYKFAFSKNGMELRRAHEPRELGLMGWTQGKHKEE
jgi:KaiC/GvpD/RAD55 family RecA-like ATPase